MKRLFERIFGFLGIGYGWCGGCSDPDCMDCQVEWDRRPSGIGHSAFGADIEPIEYDGFGSPVYPYQVDDGRPQ